MPTLVGISLCAGENIKGFLMDLASMYRALVSPGLMGDFSQYLRGVPRGDQFPMQQPRSPYALLDSVWKPNAGDLRSDGSQKGEGWLGVLPIITKKGRGVTSEYSIGVDMDGKRVEIPTLVPTLTKDEVRLMQDEIIPNRRAVPDEIMVKAMAHARERMGQGLSPFYGAEDAQNAVAGAVNNFFGTRDRNKLQESGL